MSFIKTVFSFFILSAISSVAFSQVDPVGDFNKRIAEQWKGDYTRVGQYKVKGSPYLLGESFPGSITYKGGKVVSDAKILYDLYNQKAGIDVNHQIFENDMGVESFTITLPEKFGGRKLLFKSGSVYDKPELKGYLNVIQDGTKLSLFKMYKSKLIPDPSNEMAKDTKVFEQFYDYYIYNKTTKTLSNIKLRKKDIAKEVGEDFLKAYLADSDNNSDLSNETNVVKLINFYNSTN